MRFSNWHRRGVAWVGGTFIAAIVALAGYDIIESYEAAVRNTGRELEAQARLIAEQTARSFQAVDLVLRNVAEQHRQGSFDRMSDRQLHSYLREQSAGLVQIDGLVVASADGVPRAASLLYPLPANVGKVSGFDIFEAVRQGHRGMYIDNTVKSPVDGHWVMPLGRRLETPDGRFAGAVAARGRIEYFEQFYRNVRLDPSTSIALMSQSGTLMARHPRAETAFGQRLPLYDELLAVNTGLLRAASPIDGVDRFGVLKLVPDYPLAVVVTREAAAALAPWRAQSIGTGLRTTALSALAIVLLTLLLRQLSRLQGSQERFALAVAGSNDGIVDWDVVNDRMYSSKRAMQILGIDSDVEVRSRGEWRDMVVYHPEDVQRLKRELDDFLQGRTQVRDGEYRVRMPNGAYRWIRHRNTCVRDASGRVVRVAGSVSDIDAYKRAAEALRQSEERYALAVAGSDDGVWDFDFDKREVFASARARELSGLPPGPETQSMNEWFAALPIHPEDAPKRIAAMEAHLEGKTPAYEGEFRLRAADGEYRWVRIHGLCIRDAQGKPYRMAGSISDIDARKRAEEALKASEEQYRSIFNAAADAFVLRDTEARVIDVNPAFLEISGFTRDEVVGKDRWIFAAPEQGELAREMHRRVIAGESVQFEIQALRKDGQRITIEMRAVPIRYRGRPHALGMARDITEQKKAAAERARLEGQLLQAKKLEAIGTLAGGIAHDFNNILAAILGYGDMAQRKAAEGTPLRRHIDAVVAAGMRAKSLVERILAFSRSGSGERAPIDVQSVVAEALDLLASTLPAHVRLERRLDAGAATVMGDATQIHQVVMNLCANAVQAMKTRGVLTVSLEVVERDETMAATSRLAAGRYVRLVVRDTGSGIGPQILERIFDPFFTTREVGVGTGLGLSLVHGIVTDLGGGIDVESKIGEGSAFIVYLPWCSARAPLSQGDEAPAPGEGQTILLVDDEEALVRLGEEMLAELGYEPVGFTSSAAALEAFRESPRRFDAVLSDEAMADMNGTDLAKALREIRPDIPIILMSGYVTPLFAARARNIGVAEVLSKPLVARDIARSLAGVL
jgi:PAS domain S-box-containing protein